MRFMVGKTEVGDAVFAVNGAMAVNLTAKDPAFGSDLSYVISRGVYGLVAASELAAKGPEVRADSVTPALPLARPGKIYCLGLNYVAHAQEGGYDVPDYPAIFVRSVSSLIAAGAPMIRPKVSERLDYETELMVIIGEGGRHIREEDALDHVFGYTVFNDGSVRDYQRKTHQWTPGKNFDGTGAIGPVVVTPDELPVGAAGLRITSRLNGNVMQDADTSMMIFTVANTIATISEFSTLEPGDMIAMGTPPGVGHARKPPVWMRAGDVIEVEVEGICVCRNPIVDEGDDAAMEAAE